MPIPGLGVERQAVDSRRSSREWSVRTLLAQDPTQHMSCKQYRSRLPSRQPLPCHRSEYKYKPHPIVRPLSSVPAESTPPPPSISTNSASAYIMPPTTPDSLEPFYLETMSSQYKAAILHRLYPALDEATQLRHLHWPWFSLSN